MDSVEVSEIETAKVGGYGAYVVSLNSAASDGYTKFNYQRNDFLGLRPTDIDLAHSLAEAGVIIVGESNMTFSFALAAYFQSWNGIISTLSDTVEEPNKLIDSGYSLTKETCEANHRLLLLNDKLAVASAFSTMLEELQLPLLKAPNARLPYQHMKRMMMNLIMEDCIQTSTSRIELAYDVVDANCICDTVDPFDLENSKIAGDIISRHLWFQCPWKAPGNHKGTASLLVEFLNQSAACQQPGGLVIIGVINMYPYCTQYGLRDMLVHPSYEFVGCDDRLIRELMLLGYCFQSRYVIDGAEDCHVTLVFRKRE